MEINDVNTKAYPEKSGLPTNVDTNSKDDRRLKESDSESSEDDRGDRRHKKRKKVFNLNSFDALCLTSF